VFGRDRRVVVTHSQNLFDKQVRGFEQTMGNARRQLAETSARLKRGRGRKSRAQVESEVAQVLKPRWLNRVISTTLTGEKPTEQRLVFRTKPKPKALAELHAELFGKQILFTDRDEWSVAEVVAGYRSQSGVEADFRQMKDPKVVSFSPMFHWTDQKIRVHVAHCVLALMTARLMVREADHAGMPMSVRELLSTLEGIEDVACSTKASVAAHEPGACSLRWTPSTPASMPCSASTLTPPRVDLGDTADPFTHDS
jgi:transposase